MGQLLDALPLDQRLTRYREFAEDALRRAAMTTDPTIRADLLSMAAGWHLLVGELEKTQAQANLAEAVPRRPKAPARH
jgi:hypothetical protein